MKDVLEFISNNQTLIITVVLCATFLINKLVNHMASNPKEDAWDNLMRVKNPQIAAELLEIAWQHR